MCRGGAAGCLAVSDHALIAAAAPAVVKQGGASHGGGQLPTQDATVVTAVPTAVALWPPRCCDLAVR